MTSDSSDEDYNLRLPKESSRVARKSTSGSNYSNNYPTRRQAAILNRNTKSLRSASDRFMENFNPETSAREKRKLNRKINPPSNVRRPAGAIYDENGIHLSSYMDLCDCLNEDCVGCFFECAKCGSQKCGTECRVHRRFVVDSIEYHGYDNVIKSPLVKP